MFRDNRVRKRYPVTTYSLSVLPHTHDELLQFGSDMGLPGLALFLALYGTAAWMLIYAYRHGDRPSQIIAAAVGAGMLAHGFFGVGDAITVWDRFAFLFWWLLALASAQFMLARNPGTFALD
jgi:O-antigen ligase